MIENNFSGEFLSFFREDGTALALDRKLPLSFGPEWYIE